MRYFFTKKKGFYFGGVNYKDLKKFGISEHDIKPYLPIHKNDYNKEIKIYSAIFFKSNPQTNYYLAVEKSNFKPIKKGLMVHIANTAQ